MSLESVSLSNLPQRFAWESVSTVDWGEAASREVLAILPIYGTADHGLGLPLDLEEVLGSVLLRGAVEQLSDEIRLRVLPPLRLGLNPYASGLAALDPDALQQVIREITQGVQQAGITKLAFWTTSPWSRELIATVSKDLRIEKNLQTFVIEMAGLGLSLHPGSPERIQAQAWGGHLLGAGPEPVNSAEPIDINFRPGNWSVLPATTSRAASATAEGNQATRRLARLLGEILARPLWSDAAGAIPPARMEDDLARHEGLIHPSAGRKRYLPALTPAALANLERKRDVLVVLPVGAIEQHGSHLPVGVDAMIAEAACAGLAQRLPERIWFGLTLTYGKSNEHADFPGTLSLRADSLRRIVLATVRRLHEWGFRQFALLNTHGGNSDVLVYTLREIQASLGVRAGLLRIPSSPELSERESTWGIHAGEWETSVMLAIAPELVRMDRAICHYPAHLADEGELQPENSAAVFSWMTRDIAPDGVMGDATMATKDKGHRWFETALDQLAGQIQQLN